ncbi:MAG: hypothetical protein HYX92_03950 [Chloroflexi bacterium]|nr:hypothetical protein [Chloroflexota bacterium]
MRGQSLLPPCRVLDLTKEWGFLCGKVLGGRGACVMAGSRAKPFLAVTGPRRELLAGSGLHPYFAVPHGDMMLAGPFGLVRAFAHRIEDWRDEVVGALSK